MHELLSRHATRREQGINQTVQWPTGRIIRDLILMFYFTRESPFMRPLGPHLIGKTTFRARKLMKEACKLAAAVLLANGSSAPPYPTGTVIYLKGLNNNVVQWSITY